MKVVAGLLQLVTKLIARDAEQLRRPCEVPAAPFHCLPCKLEFKLLERYALLGQDHDGRGSIAGSGNAAEHVRRQVGGSDNVAVLKNRRTLDHIAKLPDIPAPLITAKYTLNVRRYPAKRTVWPFLIEFFDVVAREENDVIAAILSGGMST